MPCNWVCAKTIKARLDTADGGGRERLAGADLPSQGVSAQSREKVCLGLPVVFVRSVTP